MDDNNVELKKIMENVVGHRLLDIGTGYGDFLKFIMRNCPSVTSAIGIDVKDSILEIAKENMTDNSVQFLKATCDDLLFDDNSFNIVGLSNVLHHLKHIEKSKNEILRVINKGDFLLINEQIPYTRTEKQKMHHLSHNLRIDMDEQLGIDHFPIYTKSQIDLLFPSKEFEVIDNTEYTIEISEEEMRKAIPQIIENFNNSLQKIKQNPRYIEFNNRFIELKELLNTIGFDEPWNYFLLLKKR